MPEVHIYTPQKFAEDVRMLVIDYALGLTMKEKEALLSVPITVRPVPLSLYSRMTIADGSILLGSTEPDKSHVYIFSKAHRHNQVEMAKTIAHELGHVIANGNHGPRWQAKALELGICPDNGFDKEYYCRTGETGIAWACSGLGAAVNALPQVVWGPENDL